MLVRSPIRGWLIVLGLACATAASCAPSAAAPIFPDRQRRAVVDDAHVLTDAQNHALSARILAYVDATHHQFVVATVPTLQGYDVKTYGYQLLRAWRLGDGKRNDGVLLLLSTNPRKVRIEVGYGLEPVLTDALTSIILQTKVVPRLKAGDVAGGLSAGADAIMAATGGAEAISRAQPMAAPGRVALIGPDGSFRKLTPQEAHDLRMVGLAFGAVLLFILLMFLILLALARRGAFAADGAGGGGSSGGDYSPTTDSSASSSSSSDSGFSGGGGSAGGGGSDSSW